jgi:hypothetical protein
MKQEEPKPIHKFNNGRGATLCNKCYAIISEGLTEELFCEKCKPKQETLEEAAEKRVPISDKVWDLTQTRRNDFIAGAKWQVERMYSYDELRRIAYNAYCKGQLDNPTEGEFNLWIQQFKKK